MTLVAVLGLLAAVPAWSQPDEPIIPDTFSYDPNSNKVTQNFVRNDPGGDLWAAIEVSSPGGKYLAGQRHGQRVSSRYFVRKFPGRTGDLGTGRPGRLALHVSLAGQPLEDGAVIRFQVYDPQTRRSLLPGGIPTDVEMTRFHANIRIAARHDPATDRIRVTATLEKPGYYRSRVSRTAIELMGTGDYRFSSAARSATPRTSAGGTIIFPGTEAAGKQRHLSFAIDRRGRHRAETVAIRFHELKVSNRSGIAYTPASGVINFTIPPAPRRPVIHGSLPPRTIDTAGDPFALRLGDHGISAADPDGRDAALSFKLRNAPSWLSFDPLTRSLVAAGGVRRRGDHYVSLTVVSEDGRESEPVVWQLRVRDTVLRLDASYDSLADTVHVRVDQLRASGFAKSGFTLRVDSPTLAFREQPGDSLGFELTRIQGIAASTRAGGSHRYSLSFDRRHYPGRGDGRPDELTVTLGEALGNGQERFAPKGPATIIVQVPPRPASGHPRRNAKVTLGSQQLTVGSPWSFTLPANLFTEPDGETLGLSADLASGKPLPQWLQFDEVTGTFSGTPFAGDEGSLRVRVTATDPHGFGAQAEFDLTVAAGPPAFELELGNFDPRASQVTVTLRKVSGTIPAPLSIPVLVQAPAGYLLDRAADPNDTPAAELRHLSFAVAAGAGGSGSVDFAALLNVSGQNGNGGAISAQPVPPDPAPYIFRDSGPVTATIGHAPLITGALAEQAALAGQPFSLDIDDTALRFVDPDGTDSALTVTASGLPDWLSYDPAERLFSGTPGVADVHGQGAAVAIALTATDPGGARSLPYQFALAVREQLVRLEGEYDPQRDTVRLRLVNLLEATSFRGHRAALRVTSPVVPTRRQAPSPAAFATTHSFTTDIPWHAAVGSARHLELEIQRNFANPADPADLVVEVSLTSQPRSTQAPFAVAGTGTLRLAIPYLSANRAPIRVPGVALPNQEARARLSYSYRVPAGLFTDTDRNDRLSYAATLRDGEPLPAWLIFQTATQTFSGTPPVADIGKTFAVKVQATDKAGLGVADYFDLAVLPDPPEFAAPVAEYDSAARILELSLTRISGGTGLDLTVPLSVQSSNGHRLDLVTDPGDTPRTRLQLEYPVPANHGSMRHLPPLRLRVSGPAGGAIGQVTVTAGESTAGEYLFTSYAPVQVPIQVSPTLSLTFEELFADPGVALSYDLGDRFRINGANPPRGSLRLYGLPSWLSYDADAMRLSGEPTGSPGRHQVSARYFPAASGPASTSQTFDVVVRAVTLNLQASYSGDDRVLRVRLTKTAELGSARDRNLELALDYHRPYYGGSFEAGQPWLTRPQGAPGSLAKKTGYRMVYSYRLPAAMPVGQHHEAVFFVNSHYRYEHRATLTLSAPGQDDSVGVAKPHPVAVTVPRRTLFVRLAGGRPIADRQVAVGQEFRMGIAQHDQDGPLFAFNYWGSRDGRTYTLDAGPSWLRMEGGKLVGTPMTADYTTDPLPVTLTVTEFVRGEDIRPLTTSFALRFAPPQFRLEVANQGAAVLIGPRFIAGERPPAGVELRISWTGTGLDGLFTSAASPQVIPFRDFTTPESDPHDLRLEMDPQVIGRQAQVSFVIEPAASYRVAGEGVTLDIHDPRPAFAIAAGVPADPAREIAFAISRIGSNDSAVDNVSVALADPNGILHADEPASQTLSFAAGQGEQTLTLRRGSGNGTVTASMTADAAHHYTVAAPGASYNAGQVSATVSSHLEYSLTGVETDNAKLTVLFRHEAGPPIAALARLRIDDPEGFLIKQSGSGSATRFETDVVVPSPDANGLARVEFARRQDTVGSRGNVSFTLLSSRGTQGAHHQVAMDLVDVRPAFTVVAGASADSGAPVEFLLRRVGSNDGGARLTWSVQDQPRGKVLEVGSGSPPPSIAMLAGEREKPVRLPRQRAGGTVTATLTPQANQGMILVAADAPQTPLTGTDSLRVTIDVAAVTDNRAPLPLDVAIAEFAVDEDRTATRNLADHFTDLDGDAMTYQATLAAGGSLPSWLRLDSASGILTATPAHAHVGSRQLTVTATDSHGASASGTLTVTVRPVDDPPRYTAIPPQAAQELTPYRIALADHLTDEEGDSLVFSARQADGSPLPAWLGLAPLTGILAGTPGTQDIGSLTIRVGAEELHRQGDGREASGRFTLTVSERANEPPAWLPNFATLRDLFQDAQLELDVLAAISDPDGDALTITPGQGFPDWLSLETGTDAMTGAATARLTGTPDNGDVAIYPLTLTVADGEVTVPLALSLRVLNVNDPTELLAGGIADSEAVVGEPYAYDVSGFFTDPDLIHGETLSFSRLGATAADTLPSWLTFDSATGAFGGTPPADALGDQVTIRVTAVGSADSARQHTAQGTFALTAVAANRAPVLSEGEGVGTVRVTAYPDYPKVSGTFHYSDPDEGDNGFGDGGTLQYYSTVYTQGFENLEPRGSIEFGYAGKRHGIWGDFNIGFRNGVGHWDFYVDRTAPTIQNIQPGDVLRHSVRFRIDDGADANANRYSDEVVVEVIVYGPPAVTAPVVAVAAATGAPGQVAFTVTRSGAADSALEALVRVADPQGFIEPTDHGTHTVSFAAQESERTLAVARSVASPKASSGTVTAQVRYGPTAGYQLSPTAASASVTVTNAPPQPRDDRAAIGEDGREVVGRVLGNDSDPDQHPLHVGNYAPGRAIGQDAVAAGTAVRGAYGHLNLGRDGAYTYTPHGGAQGLKADQREVDYFTYEVSDGPDTATAELQVTVTGANDRPTAAGTIANRRVFAGEELLIRLDSVFIDADGDALSYSGSRGGAALPAWLGDFDQAAATLRVAPQATHVGTYAGIVISASDGSSGACGTCQVPPFTVTVLAANQPPRPGADQLSLDEDAAAATPDGGLLGNDRDADSGDTLTVTRVAAGADIDHAPVTPGANGENLPGRWGVLRVAADGSYTYTPTNARLQFLGAGDSESDVFAYEVNDGSGAGNAAAIGMLTVTLSGANDRPRITLPAGTAPTVTAATVDTAGRPTAAGSVDYADPDARDVALGNGGSIEGRGAAAAAFQAGTEAGQTLAGSHGDLLLFADGRWEYRLDQADAEVIALAPDGTLTDSFVLRVDDGSTHSDGSRYSADLELDITIMPAGEPPRLVTTTCRTADEDVCSSLEYNPDSGNLQLRVFDGGGIVPPRQYRVKYRLSMSGGASVTQVNKKPVTLPYVGNLDVRGGSSPPALFRVVRGVAPGTATVRLLAATSLNGTPAPQIREEGREKSIMLPGRPRAVADRVTLTNFSAPLRGNVLANDRGAGPGMLRVTGYASGSGSSVSLFAAPATQVSGDYGSLAITAAGQFTYRPATAAIALIPSGETRADVFTYKAWDGLGERADDAVATTLTVSITAANTAPRALIDVLTLNEDSPVQDVAAAAGLLVNDEDDNQDALTVTGISAGPTLATVPVEPGIEVEGTLGFLTVAADGSYRYRLKTAQLQSLGKAASDDERFSYRVSDGSASAAGILWVIVNGRNDPPVENAGIAGRTASVGSELRIAIGDNAFADADGDSLRFTAAGQPAWLPFDGRRTFAGTPTAADVTATPITVTVTATDGNGGSGTATFAIAFADGNSNPRVVTELSTLAVTARTATEDASFTLAVAAHFADDDVDGTTGGDSLRYSFSSVPATGRWLTLNADSGSFGGVPRNEHVGSYRITVRATDRHQAAVTSAFTLTVANVNDAPVLGPAAVTARVTEASGDHPGRPATGRFTYQDVDADDRGFGAGGDLQLRVAGGTWQTVSASSLALPGTFGNLAVTRTGSWSYSADNANARVDALNGDSVDLADNFEIRIDNGADKSGGRYSNVVSLKAAIAGANDPPTVAAAIGPRTVAEGATLAIDLTAVFADVDDASLDFTVTGQPAWLRLRGGNRLEGSPSRADITAAPVTVTVTAADAAGASAVTTFALTVASANVAPTAGNDELSIGEDDGGGQGGRIARAASRGLLANDSAGEAGDTLVLARYAAGDDLRISPVAAGTDEVGRLGTLNAAADGSYTYTLGAAAQALDHGEIQADVFTYEIVDGAGAANSRAVGRLQVRVSGANDRPSLALAGGADLQVATMSLDGQFDVEASGNFTYADVDEDDRDFGDGGAIQGRAAASVGFRAGTSVGRSLGGRYGNLILSADGSWRYLLDAGNAEILALTAGGGLQDEFLFRIDDGAGVPAASRYSAELEVAIIIVPAMGSGNEQSTTCAAADSTVCSTFRFDSQQMRISLEVSDGGVTPTRFYTVVYALNVTGDAAIRGGDGQPLSLPYNGALETRSDQGASVSFAVTRGVNPATILAELRATASSNAMTAPEVREEGRIKALTVPARPRAAADDALVSDLAVPVSGSLVVNDQAPAAGTLQVIGYQAGSAVGSAPAVPDTVVSGSYGSLTVTAAGAFTYTPDAEATASLSPGDPATDTFAYRVWDGLGATADEGNYADAVLRVRLLGQDLPPGAGRDDITVMEDDDRVTVPAATGLLANDSDDGGRLAVTGYNAGTTLAAEPAEPGEEVAGTFGFLTAAADGAFTYRLRSSALQQLPKNARETDTFTYRVGDGVSSASGRLVVTILGENDLPQRLSEIADLAIAEGQPLSLTVADHFSDTDAGDRLRYRYSSLPAIATEPVWLTLDEHSGLLSGTPPPGAHGDFTITVVAADGFGGETQDSFALAIAPAPSTITAWGGSADNTTARFAVTRSGGNTTVPLAVRVSLDGGTGDAAGSYLVAADAGERLVQFAAGETTVTVTARRSADPAADSGTIRLTVLPSADGRYLLPQNGSSYALHLSRPLPTYTLAARYDAARDGVTVSLTVASGRLPGTARRRIAVGVAIDGGMGVRHGSGVANATGSVELILDGATTRAEAEWAVDRSSANAEAQFTASVSRDVTQGGLLDFQMAGARELTVTVPYRNYRPVVDQGLPELRVRIGETINFPIPDNAFSDPNGDALSYAAPVRPQWLSFDGRHFTGVAREDVVTPPLTFTVTVRADDGSETVETTFPLVVTEESAFVLESVAATDERVTLSLRKVAGPTVDVSLDFAVSGAVGLLSGHDFGGRVSVPAPPPAADGTVTVAFQRAADGISPSGAIRFELVAGAGYVPAGNASASTEELADLKPAFGIAVATPADPAASMDFMLRRLGSNTAAADVTVSVNDLDGALATTVGATQTVAFAAGESEQRLRLELDSAALAGSRVTAGIAATADYNTGPVTGATVNTGREEATAVLAGQGEPPVITGTVPDQVTAPGRQFELDLENLVQLSDSDSDAAALSLAVTGLPEGIAYLEGPRRLAGVAAATAVGEHQVTLTPMDDVPVAGVPLTFKLSVLETVVSLAAEHVRVGDLVRVTVTQVQGMTRTGPLQVELTVNSPTVPLRRVGGGSLFGTEHIVELELPAFMADGATVVTDFAFDRAERPGQADGDEIAIAIGSPSGTAVPEFLIDGEAELRQRVPYRPANSGPRAARAIPLQRAWLHREFSFQFADHDAPDGVFADEDYDRLSYSATLANSSALPRWLNFDPATRTFRGQPAGEDLDRVFVVRLTATDLGGETASADFSLTVLRANAGPRIVQPIADVTIGAGEDFALDGAAAFVDVDGGDELSYSYISDLNLSSWLSFVDGRFSGVPPNGFSGVAAIELTATDGAQESITASFTLTIEPVTVRLALDWEADADAVALTVSKELGVFQQEQTLAVTLAIDDGLLLVDEEGAAVASLALNPSFGPADSGVATRLWKWRIDRAAASGRGRMTAAVAPLTAAGDDFFAVVTASGEHPLTVPAYRNTAPVAVAATARQLAVAGEAFQLDLDALFIHDDPLDPLAFAAVGLPAWLRYDDQARALVGTPQDGDITATAVPMEVTATDTDGAEARVELPLIVTDLAGAEPVAAADALTVGEDDGRVASPHSLLANDRLTDPAGRLAVIRVAAGAELGAGSAQVGTAVAGAFGTLTVVSDGSYVYEVDAAVADALGAGESREDQFAYQLTDGRARGAHSIAGAVLTVTIMGANDAPSPSGRVADQVVVVDESFSLTLPANLFEDAEGDALTLEASGIDGAALPDWLHMTVAADGSYQIEAQPAAEALVSVPRVGAGGDPTDSGSYTVVITATDGGGASGEIRFKVMVVQPNSPPAVAAGIGDQWRPAAVDFSFQVPADAFMDKDGDSLTFTAAGLPAWLAFDSAAARFAGNPGHGHSGEVATITVTAADGKGGTAETRFNIWLGDPNYAPELMLAMGDAVAYAGVPFERVLPGNMFRDGNQDEMSYSAAMQDGGELPDWLKFDSHGFRGVPTVDDISADAHMITVRSDDIHGARGEMSFGLTVAVPPSIVSLQAEDGGLALAIPYLELAAGPSSGGGGGCMGMSLRSTGEGIGGWALVGSPAPVDCVLPPDWSGTPSLGADFLMNLPLVAFPQPEGETTCFGLQLEFHAADDLRLAAAALLECPAIVDLAEF